MTAASNSGLQGLSSEQVDSLKRLMAIALDNFASRDFNPASFPSYVESLWGQPISVDSMLFEVKNAPGSSKLGITGAQTIAQLALADRSLTPSQDWLADRSLQLYRRFNENPTATFTSILMERSWRRLANSLGHDATVEWLSMEDAEHAGKLLSADAYMVMNGDNRPFIGSDAREAIRVYRDNATDGAKVGIYAVNQIDVLMLAHAAAKIAVAMQTKDKELEESKASPSGGFYTDVQTCMLCNAGDLPGHPVVQRHDIRLGIDRGALFHEDCWQLWLKRNGISTYVRNQVTVDDKAWVEFLVAMDKVIRR